MELVTQARIDSYLQNDTTAQLLDRLTHGPGDEALTSQRWLRSTPAKRYIFSQLYGDLIESRHSLRVLDVGGGLTCVTRELADRHDYSLFELLAHGEQDTATQMVQRAGRDFIMVADWCSSTPEGHYDLVIANDLFPNVDQRLELFLARYLPCSRRLRLSLTYYPEPRFYATKRIGADELLCMLAWNGEHTQHVLGRFAHRIGRVNLDLLTRPNTSVFPNGRQVCLVEFRGDVL